MTPGNKTWQADADAAFRWLVEVYEQAATLFDDSKGHLEEGGWSTHETGFGGVAGSFTLSEWPFVYMKAVAALPPGTKDSAAAGKAAVFGVVFFDGVRAGPTAFGGAIEWSKDDAETNHWMIYSALGCEGPNRHAFDRTEGPIRTVRLNAMGRKVWPGVEGMDWIELPLSALESAERVRELVAAAKGLALSDEEPARRLAGSL